MPRPLPRRQARPIGRLPLGCLLAGALALGGCGAPGAAKHVAPSVEAAAARDVAWPTAINAHPLAPRSAPSEQPPGSASPTPAPAAPSALPPEVEPLPPPVEPEPAPSALPPEGALAPVPAVLDAGAHRLAGLTHTWQKWNNCGPSSAVMALSAFGIARDQLEAAAELKPHDRDTNVTPDELAAYLGRQGLEALVRPGGNRERVRALLRAGVPVLAEQWIAVDGRGEMGHYRVLFGFDDVLGVVLAMDSYYGANRAIPYDVLEAEWRPFLGTYVVGFLPGQRDAVLAALGPDRDAGAAWARVSAILEGEAAGGGKGAAWTWFALGEARERTGDGAGAIGAFERAIAFGLPVRAFWYQFGYARALAAAGAWDRLLAHADATVGTMDGQNLEEWHFWRGQALRALGREVEAVAAFERALAFNANLAPARAALGAR